MLVYPSCQSMYHDSKVFKFQQQQQTREDDSTTSTTSMKKITTTTTTTSNNNNNNNDSTTSNNNSNNVDQQNVASTNLRDRLKSNLSLNNLEPRKNTTSIRMNTGTEYPTTTTTTTTSQSPQTSATNFAPSTSQPSTPTPTQILFPKHVTEEQEAYVRGFAQALEELYKKQGPPVLSTDSNNFPDELTQRLGNPKSEVVDTKISSSYVPSVSNIRPLNTSSNMVSQTSNFQNLTSNNLRYEPAFINLEPATTFNYGSSLLHHHRRPYVQSTSSFWPPPFQNQTKILNSNYPDSSFVTASTPAIFQNVSVSNSPSGKMLSTTSKSFSSGNVNVASKSSDISMSYADSPLGTTNSSCDSDDLTRVQSYSGSFTTLDMGEQEKLRLERKRAKNRIAAQKCQLRKVERIQQLENKVNQLKQRNQILSERASNLRSAVENLKRTINLHASKGCRLLSSSAYNSFEIMNS